MRIVSPKTYAILQKLVERDLDKLDGNELHFLARFSEFVPGMALSFADEIERLRREIARLGKLVPDEGQEELRAKNEILSRTIDWLRGYVENFGEPGERKERDLNDLIRENERLGKEADWLVDNVISEMCGRLACGDCPLHDPENPGKCGRENNSWRDEASVAVELAS